MDELVIENIKKVTVPLTVDQIKEFFVDKNMLYLVDYKNSELSQDVFLTYLANLDLPYEIDFTGCSMDEIEQIFVSYMTSKGVSYSNSLTLNLAQIILEHRGVDTTEIFDDSLFSKQQIDQFIARNTEMLNRWEQFLESTLLYAQFIIAGFEGQQERIKAEYEVVEDEDFVGTNIVNLFQVPYFLELFYAAPFKHELKYYKYQFENNMFKGNTLGTYFVNENNDVLWVFVGMLKGVVGVDEFYNVGDFASELITKEGGVPGPPLRSNS